MCWTAWWWFGEPGGGKSVRRAGIAMYVFVIELPGEFRFGVGALIGKD